MNPAVLVSEFHTAVEQKYLQGGHHTAALLNSHNQLWNHESAMAALRRALVDEEAKELLEAMETNDLGHIAKEAADLIYVTVALFPLLGLDFEPVFRAVHENNMAKVKNGTVRDDGKLVKPEDHPKVNLSHLNDRVYANV